MPSIGRTSTAPSTATSPASSTPGLKTRPGDGHDGLPVCSDGLGVEFQRPGRRGGQRQRATAWATPPPHRAGQVAFLQNTGTISQVMNFPASGAYTMAVSAAQQGFPGLRATRRLRCEWTALGGHLRPRRHRLRHLHSRLVPRDGRQSHDHVRRRRSQRGGFHRLDRSGSASTTSRRWASKSRFRQYLPRLQPDWDCGRRDGVRRRRARRRRHRASPPAWSGRAWRPAARPSASAPPAPPRRRRRRTGHSRCQRDGRHAEVAGHRCQRSAAGPESSS